MNQNPEQIARDEIDRLLQLSGWNIQNKNRINWNAGIGIAVREYQTDSGPADYILFIDRKPAGIIEAKREEEGHRLTVHEEQSHDYATRKLKYIENDPLPFVYESTGTITRFTDYRDPKPRSRNVFSFHRPETFTEWLKKNDSLRKRFHNIPLLSPSGLRDCQINAISNLEESFRNNKPRALVQMATGAGKTYTAITSVYRLLKFADAKRILFLVDTKNLGEQAEQEFMAYLPNDDNRKFTELYNVQRLRSRYIATDSQVCISTIQRLYSILQDEELDDSAEETNPAESSWQPKEPMPVVYNEKIPPEFFDFIVIDECHRSIYNLWKQVLDYFDAFLIGLTATPDKRTFAFFEENVVSEYTHEEAVADGVNVGYDVYTIETEITHKGSVIWKGEYVDKREKLTRKMRWEQMDQDLSYSSGELDKDVVNISQIRHIIRTFKNKLPEIFPGRKEIPKTLIFAKTDSHADDIIQMVRTEFNEGNEFCKKLTYKSKEDPKSVLAQFRNAYNPRIAVTVDMVATGTDVKPLECLVFMRDVRSTNYFEQMKGRGTRTLGYDDLRKVTPSVISGKTHFIIVDAVGATKSIKTDSRPLERKKNVPLKDLLNAILMGARDEDLFLSLANRLARLERQITPEEKNKFEELADGKSINKVVRVLLTAYNPDAIESKAEEIIKKNPDISFEKAKSIAQEELIETARSTFNGELNEYIDNVRKSHEQVIDTVNLDNVTFAGWDKDAVERSRSLIAEFSEYIESHKDEITALRIFYGQPYSRRDITYNMIKDVYEKLIKDKPNLAPINVWRAYELVENRKASAPADQLIMLVSLIRRVTGIDQALTPYDKTVDKNFKNWIFKKHSGAGEKFTDEQMEWLRMIKDHIATSFHADAEDLDYTPFDSKGGRGKMWELFGDEMNRLIDEMNEVLAG